MYPYKSHAIHEILPFMEETSNEALTQAIEEDVAVQRHEDMQDRGHGNRPGHGPGNRPGPGPGPGHHLRPVPPVENIPWMKPPSFRPPSREPQREFGIRLIDPPALKRCEGSLAYLWLRGRRSRWMYITYVSRRTVYGYSWTALGWRYGDLDIAAIETFFCHG